MTFHILHIRHPTDTTGGLVDPGDLAATVRMRVLALLSLLMTALAGFRTPMHVTSANQRVAQRTADVQMNFFAKFLEEVRQSASHDRPCGAH